MIIPRVQSVLTAPFLWQSKIYHDNIRKVDHSQTFHQEVE